MHLYIKFPHPLEETARAIAGIALPGYQCQAREGLNLGGGEYFRFFTEASEILLVCNDTAHAEVFVGEKAAFPFYCYLRKGNHAILAAMQAALANAGFCCELGDAEN